MAGNTFYFSFEPVLMEWLQRMMGSAGVPIASFLTMLGEELLLVALMGFLYWCYDKEFGKFLGTNMVAALVWNPLAKNILLRRRPYFDHPNVQCLRPVEPDANIYDIVAQGYSFPSGHSTNSAALFGSLAAYRRNRVLLTLAFAIPFLVGISRVQLGVHYPTDVLVGWLMGGAVVLLLSYLQRRVKRRWLLHLILFLTALPGVFYCKTDDYYTGLGIMAGFFLAMPFEERFVRFENTKKPLRCVLRLVCGFVLYFALNTLLKLPFPQGLLDGATPAAFTIRTVRYAIVTFVMFAVYPMAFRKERQGQTKDQP